MKKIPHFFQSKLVYTGHIYAFSTDLINLPYESVEVLFFMTQNFVQIPGEENAESCSVSIILVSQCFIFS
jgi:hypothetical protein